MGNADVQQVSLYMFNVRVHTCTCVCVPLAIGHHFRYHNAVFCSYMYTYICTLVVYTLTID